MHYKILLTLCFIIHAVGAKGIEDEIDPTATYVRLHDNQAIREGAQAENIFAVYNPLTLTLTIQVFDHVAKFITHLPRTHIILSGASLLDSGTINALSVSRD